MPGVMGWKAQVASFHWSIGREIGNHPEKPLSICTDLGKRLIAWELCFMHLISSGYQAGGHQTQGEMQKRDTLIESLGIALETVHVNYCRLKRELGDHISRKKAGPRAIHMLNVMIRSFNKCPLSPYGMPGPVLGSD